MAGMARAPGLVIGVFCNTLALRAGALPDEVGTRASGCQQESCP